MNQQKNPKIPWWQPGLALFVRLSAWIGGPVIAAVMVGKYLDRLFNSQPWLLLVSVSVAFVISIVMIVRIGLKEMNFAEKQNNNQETNSKKQTITKNQ